MLHRALRLSALHQTVTCARDSDRIETGRIGPERSDIPTGFRQWDLRFVRGSACLWAWRTVQTSAARLGRRYARDMDYFLTPADLSRELGVDQRKVRAYLREQYGRLTRSETRWRLNDQRAAKVRARFRAEL